MLCLYSEPDSYSAAGQTTLTPERIGNDFVLLNSLLHLYPNMATSRIVGPDVVGTGGASSPGLKIIQGSVKFLFFTSNSVFLSI